MPVHIENKIKDLNLYAIHLEHEYCLYEYRDIRGIGDFCQFRKRILKRFVI